MQNEQRNKKNYKATLLGIAINFFLSIVKGASGVLGNSYALVADAIESMSDVLTSCIVLLGIKLSSKPADSSHPYGHGKFEPLVASVVAMILIAAALLIAVKSIQEILTPHHLPEAFTLVVLLLAVIIKELLFRYVIAVSNETESLAVKTDAWHHRSDAITSACAFIGISIALIGGKGFESADDFAALIAAAIIAINAILLLKPALYELIDTAPDKSIADKIREIAAKVEGVEGTHKCHVRKVGFDYYVDLDVLCNPELSIRAGHEIAHNVGEAIHKEMQQITKILVHVEPADDYGRRSRDRLGE